MKFVCIFASLGVAAASMKGKMVVDAYGDIVLNLIKTRRNANLRFLCQNHQ